VRLASSLFSAMLVYLSLAVAGVATARPLEPNKAFAPSAAVVSTDKGAAIELKYKVTPGYYLYKDRFKFTLAPTGADLAAPAFPEALEIDDPNFGKMAVYKQDFTVTLPVKVTQPGLYRLNIAAQGCAEEGFCYPVFKNGLTVELPVAEVSSKTATKPKTKK
jgi:thioredoxin:protein disulfide reductase